MRTPVSIIAGFAVGLLSAAVPAFADEVYLPDANGCRIYDPNPKPDETVTWSGGCVDGYGDGPGVVQWLHGATPGTRSEGPLVRGRFDGQVTEIFQNGARFEGTFVAGAASGRGVWTGPKGERYEGDFVRGKWSGEGTFTNASGGRYSGTWVDGKRQGQGEEVWSDGSRYAGAFVDNEPADPKSIVRQTYAITRSTTGSVIPQRAMTNIDVPVDKNYAQLTPQEQRRVRALYDGMPETDAPPYPLHGQRPILDAAMRIERTLRITGELTLAVTVDPKGEPTDVQMIRSPDPQMTKMMAYVLMLQKYSPASCKGVPCQMQYPIRIDFKRQ
jgi:hypothetical protein